MHILRECLLCQNLFPGIFFHSLLQPRLVLLTCFLMLCLNVCLAVCLPVHTAPTTKTTTVGPTIMTSPPSHPATVTSDVVSRQTTSRTVPPVTTGVLYPTLSPTHTTGTTSTSDALGKTPGDITSTTLTYVIVGSLVFVLFVCVIVFVCYLRMTCLKISGTVPAKVKRQHNLCAGNANNQGGNDL